MRRLLVLATALALIAFACGGGDDGESAPTQAPTTTQAEVAAGDAANGESLYQGTCVACHGPDATGIEGLGKSLIGSDFVNDATDEELVAFLKVGRPAGDLLNTTGVDMPPKGGNPALSDDDLRDITAYLRSLN